jgi:hypothetical protein
MRWICSTLLITLAGLSSLQAQTPPPPPPQTARQALIEMFLGKNSEAFEKHLPDVARQFLIHKGDTPDTSIVQKIAMIGRQMTTQGEHIETFDEGPTLLVSDANNRRDKVEVMVEHDSLIGEEDEIEVSVHLYRNGEPEFLPVVPRLIFSMKEEKEIWRLNEVTVALHAPLTDPEYLKGLRKEQNEANENMASVRVSMIASAELSYAAKHPDQGYTCKLADLFRKETPADGSDPSPEGYDQGMADTEFASYRLALSGCEGSPASKFQIAAVPIESDSEMKTFCSDQSGAVRFLVGKAPSCLSHGQPLNPRGDGSPALIE